MPKEATIVFSEDTVDPGRADQHLTGNSAVPVAFVPQGYTRLLLGSLERPATPMAYSWKHQNPVPEKAGVCLLTLQLKPRPIYTGRWCREGKNYESAHPVTPGHAHNFSLFLIPAARRGWDGTNCFTDEASESERFGDSPTPQLEQMGTITGHCHFTNVTRKGNFPVLFPTIYPGVVPGARYVPTVFRMNEYERRVGTWSDSQPRLLCVMLRVLYKTAGNSAMWL